ncbi:hypothetical protein PPL_08146 [Heterostelium album PN500]|uniref:Major facilitator superfamily (MFS) profile domain-containing protein n=1 Tax=Heterostelium pallidum (strain ATCC 26659 / Pp 5 / PN500) TaxID=670386 RepID=D3BIR1_HETP5|nr:hypothetical protein PPL_08146 [Heterostelium album PN500]EFA78685.1 hypothetical protein PPL_08146 [Heterostelium album PN500]|eukprot:XP_020430809.1 hypothetical protein PPL_08146 [Heterostelium album PN500]
METPESTLSDHSQMKHSEVSSESSSVAGKNYWLSKQLYSSYCIILTILYFSQHHSWFFGNSVITSAITGSIWPFQIFALVGAKDKEFYSGIIPIAGTLLNLIMLVLVGYLSDVLKTRFGRRRPFILVGSIIMIVFLMAMAPFKDQSYSVASYIGYNIAYNFGQGMAAGAFSGIIPDIVPPEKVGIASGWLGVTWSLGSLVGVLISGRALNDYAAHPENTQFVTVNGIICGIFAFSSIIAVVFLWEDTQDSFEFKGTVMGFFKSLHLPVKTYYNFYWVLLARFFNCMGVSTIVGYLYYFVLNILGRANTMDYSLVYSVMIVFSIPSSIAGGYLADYFDTKKMVYVAALIQSVAISLYILITHHPSWAGMLVLVALFGVGYGFYQCVDWALALRVLPQKHIGKDMGVWHIAFNLPSVIAPPVVSAIFRIRQTDYNYTSLDAYYRDCYSIVFGIAAIYFLLATVLIYPLEVHKPEQKRKDEESVHHKDTKMTEFNNESATIETN